ncbi:AsnC family protein [Streptomyces tendae]|uniref:AsnC family protein n=1 Tax=Streptomyces tendae TaxID=1932 RepID=UPI003405D1F5
MTPVTTAGHSAPDASHALDQLDLRLLQALRIDGRATLTDLQRVTGLSETAVRKRLNRLRARECCTSPSSTTMSRSVRASRHWSG